MKSWYVVLTIALVGALAGCSRGQAIPANTGSSQSYTSAYLNTSYPNALDVSSQLALGTIQLEDTENAVTPEQAKTLLPLWQALQGGVTAQAEINAVLKQIEKTMTQEQLQAIAAMQLTQEDLQAWMQEQGLQMPGGPGWAGGGLPTPGAMTTRPAWSGEGEMPPEMATRRAEFENMSEEERAAMRATAEASGGMPGRPGGVRGAGGGQLMILLNPLIELLKTRAGG
ncbi:MAG: hypothetical protein ONB14_12805 [candidate division KSB1 bacterium]|nr:hypothetical protein [candidate division KSB1 bacterium]